MKEDDEDEDFDDDDESADEDEESDDDESADEDEESDDDESADEDEESDDDEDEPGDEDEESSDAKEAASRKNQKGRAPAARVEEPERPREIPVAKVPPERAVVVRPRAAQISKAREALEALQKGLGGRSWKVGALVRKTRRALEAVAGIDPQRNAALGAAFDAVMASVTAEKKRLPLEDALVLLNQVEAGAFKRATSQWKGKEGPLGPAIAVLHAISESIEDGELALYVGRLIANRKMPRSAFKKIWKRVGPLVAGTTLSSALERIDLGNDTLLKSRISDQAP